MKYDMSLMYGTPSIPNEKTSPMQVFDERYADTFYTFSLNEPMVSNRR